MCRDALADNRIRHVPEQRCSKIASSMPLVRSREESKISETVAGKQMTARCATVCSRADLKYENRYSNPGLYTMSSSKPHISKHHEAPACVRVGSKCQSEMQCNAMRYDAVRCDAMRCNDTLCITMKCNTMRGNTMQCNAMKCSAVQ